MHSVSSLFKFTTFMNATDILVIINVIQNPPSHREVNAKRLE